MTANVIDHPCVVFALGRESQAFRRHCRPVQCFPAAPCWMRFCACAGFTLLVVETGVGTERTQRALQWLLNSPLIGNAAYRPKVVISAGFAGALDEKLQIGDVLLATEVIDPQGLCWPTTWPVAGPGGPGQLPLHRGRLVSAPQLLGTPEEKRRWGQQHQAVAVDMESAAVARLCNHYQVPFACVRSISDDARTPLSPRLLSLLADGRVSWPRLLTALVCQPRLAAELWRLAKNTRYAGQQLSHALWDMLKGK